MELPGSAEFVTTSIFENQRWRVPKCLLRLAFSRQGGVDLGGKVSNLGGQNPNANIETGKDQDGSLVLNRLWLSANASF